MTAAICMQCRRAFDAVDYVGHECVKQRVYECPWCPFTGDGAAYWGHRCDGMAEALAMFDSATDKARRHPSLASAGGPPPHPPTRGPAGPVPFVLRPLSADEPHVGAPGRRSIEGDAS